MVSIAEKNAVTMTTGEEKGKTGEDKVIDINPEELSETELLLHEAIKQLERSVREVVMLVIRRTQEQHLQTEAATIKALYEMRQMMDRWFNSMSGRVNDFIQLGDVRFDRIWHAIDEDRNSREHMLMDAKKERETHKLELLAAISKIHIEMTMRLQGIEESVKNGSVDDKRIDSDSNSSSE